MYYWGDDRRFNSYNSYFKREFGGRLQKISIDAGFSCPNRDGKISHGGCTFCRNDAFNPSYCRPEKSVKEQITEGIAFHRVRYRRAKSFLAYFQPYSNTYKPTEELYDIYSQALNIEGVGGIVIGTRPDCINEETLCMLERLKEEYTDKDTGIKPIIIIELGIESVYDETLRRINRGHDFATAADAVKMVHQHGFPCGGHYIFGLPGETREMMINSADIISELPLTTIKFHQLQIFKDTKMAEEYLANSNNFKLFTLEEYIDFIIDYVERLNPNIVIERFAGEVPPRFLVSKPWLNLRYDQVLNMIENRLEQRDTYQGKLFRINK